MENNNATRTEKFMNSITVKGLIIGVLTLLLLIPGVMIQGLILERQDRSKEAIREINAKWSQAQTLCGPILTVPYSSVSTGLDGKQVVSHNEMHFVPEVLEVDVKLNPEEKYYGIYKAILYKSEISISGKFARVDFERIVGEGVELESAFLRMGLSDLKGIAENIEFTVNGRRYIAEVAGDRDNILDKVLNVNLNDAELLKSDEDIAFSSKIFLKGSGSINFIPVGKTTMAKVNGAWADPGFIGNFTPDFDIEGKSFSAKWNVLHFNRNIPDMWKNDNVESFRDTSFGVNLVETVDHYQQNMRSAKYALMFIALTFAVFFFVEIITRKKIHPVQYLLVGIALILFYSLLLSLSEQLNFMFAYFIASAATIGLITVYAHSIFKNRMQTGILTVVLIGLYSFLYVILQLQDRALMVGSIGLFLILALVMYISRKINWYKATEDNPTE